VPINMDDYVDVAARLQEFYAKYPDGRICTRSVEILDAGALAIADAYRTPDDPRPGVGTAWEPIPGKTNFTRDSEVQNAETAAWGRAIVAVGIPSKKIASLDEVKARDEDDAAPPAPPRPALKTTQAQQRKIAITASEHDIDDLLRYRITRMLFGVTSSKDVPRSGVDRLLQALVGFAGEREANLAYLLKWEAEHLPSTAAQVIREGTSSTKEDGADLFPSDEELKAAGQTTAFDADAIPD
jgi:hypothetical protein